MSIKSIMVFLSVLVISIYTLLCAFIYLKQDSFLFYPEKLNSNFELNFLTDYREMNLQVNGAVLNLVLFKIPAPKGLVIFFHGNAGSIRTWGGVADAYLDLGYDCLMYDYRGYGKSTGSPSSGSFISDALSVIDFAGRELHYKNINYVGQSLGSGIAAKAASLLPPSKLVLITPYYSLASLASKFFPYLPVSILLKYEFDTYLYLKALECPVYLIHGSEDELIPSDHSLRLKDVNSTIKFTVINGAGHNNLYNFREFHLDLQNIFSNKP